jgi:hypothetical protein
LLQFTILSELGFHPLNDTAHRAVFIHREMLGYRP